MPDWAQIISDALDILKFDGAVQDTLAELRENGFYEKCSGWLAKFNERYGTSACSYDHNP